MENGLGGSIMTFWEITEGDLTDEKGAFLLNHLHPMCSTLTALDFHAMPLPLLRKAIDTLVKRGKAQIIKGDGEAGEGARFF